MAYTQNEKSTGLDVLTTLASGDLHIVGDVSDSGRAKAITEDNLETTIANSTNFTDALVANTNFTTDLANDSNFTTVLGNNSNFVTTLTNNSAFQTSVNNFVTGGGGGGGGGTKLAIDTTAFSHTGDTTETTAYTIAIPAGTLGTNNAIRFYLLGSSNGNSADVTYRIKYGTTTVATIVDTSGTNADLLLDGNITADTSSSSQVSSARFIKSGNIAQSTDGTDSTENSTTTLNLVVTVENASAGATTSFKGIIVESISNLSDGVSFVAVANQDLTAGQTVGISSLGGGVAIASKAKSAFSLADTGASAEYVPLGSDKVFILYKVNASNTLKGVIGTIDRATMTISVGTAVQYTTTLSGSFAICLLDTNKVAVMYAESGAPKAVKIHVSTVSGSTITANTQQAFITLTNNLSGLLITQVATDKAVVFTSESSVLNPLVTAFTVSGTTLGSVGTGVTSIEASRIVSHTTNAFSMFGNVASVAEDSIQIGTVSGTAITLGSSVTVSTFQASLNASGLCVADSTHIVFSYGLSGDSAIRCASISGTTPTLGTQLTTGSAGGSSIEYDANATRFIYKDFSKAYTLSGTTLSLQCAIAGTGWDSGKWVYMGTYYATITIGSVGNYTTIEGMCGTFLPGFVSQTVSRGGNAIITIKGKISGFTNLIAGNKYTANGSGGISQNDSGEVTAITDTTVSL